MRWYLSVAAAALLRQSAAAANVCPVLSSQLLKVPVVASVVSKDCSSFLRTTVTPALFTITQTSAVTITTSTSIVPSTVSTDVRSTTVTTVTVLDGRTVTSTVTNIRETATVSNVQTDIVSVTLPATVTQFVKRATAAARTPPKYASKVSGLYSKACSCIGVNPCTTTLRALSTTITKTVTSYAVASAASKVTATTILPLTASTVVTSTVATVSQDVDVTGTVTVDATTLLTQTVTVPVSTVRLCNTAAPTFSALAESLDPAFQHNGEYPTYQSANGETANYLSDWANDGSNSKFFLRSGLLYMSQSGRETAPLFISTPGYDFSFTEGVIFVEPGSPDEKESYYNLRCSLAQGNGARQTLQCDTEGGESVFYYCPTGKGVNGQAVCFFKPNDSRAAGCQAFTLTALC